MRAEHKVCAVAALALASCSRPADQPLPIEQSVPTAVRSAPDLRIFDLIELGKPVPVLPPCDDAVPLKPCLQTWRSGTPTIYLPALQLADRYSSVVAFEQIEGNIERVWLNSTKRLGADREVLIDLHAKYGVPSAMSRDEATLAEIVSWDLETLNVIWSSHSLERTHGQVLIQTKRGRDHAVAHQREIDAATPKL